MSETHECGKGTDSNLCVNQMHLILCHIAHVKKKENKKNKIEIKQHFCVCYCLCTGTALHALRKIYTYKYCINIQDGTQNVVSVCTDGDLLSLQPIKSGINHDRSRKLPATQHDIQTSNNNKI